MRIALAGAGAFGIKHLDGLAEIDGVTVTAIVSRSEALRVRGAISRSKAAQRASRHAAA